MTSKFHFFLIDHDSIHDMQQKYRFVVFGSGGQTPFVVDIQLVLTAFPTVYELKKGVYTVNKTGVYTVIESQKKNLSLHRKQLKSTLVYTVNHPIF